MKTDFPILWIDDKKSLVDPLKKRLEDWLDKKGFTLVVHFHADGEKIIDDLGKKDIELIILDYKLRGAKTGDQIIQEIREQSYYQDIIFYSQGGIHNNVFSRPPDGVFFVDKNDAIQRIKELIDLKINRLSDLSILRGWIVADAIELEHTIGELLALCFKEKASLFTARILEAEGLLDFGKKHRILNGILKDKISHLNITAPRSPLLENLQASKKILNTFDEEVIGIRNALAHQKAELLATGRKKIRTMGKQAKEIEITPTHCVSIRNNIRKHQKNLAAVKLLIESQDWT
ncbi:MAG: hypothetical protein LBK76_05995 [Verrucomicrobiales bacterium]|jgi:hypothetical protein|nr:hypothetical protein [Verrucomicrobiales bacterium]